MIIRSLPALLAILVLSSFPLAAQDAWIAQRVSFENPASPEVVAVDLLWGRIEVTTHDADDVQLEVRAQGPDDGLRSLAAPRGYEVVRDGGRITVRAAEPGSDVFRSLEVRISVPRGVAVDLDMTRGGDIEVTDFTGSADITNLNGSVRLRGIDGDARVDARNGEVDAEFVRVTPERPMVFATLNGGITLRVPEATAADVHVVASGDVRTDLDLVVESRDADPPMASSPSGAANPLEAPSFRGRLNGGGPSFYLQSFNGPVQILATSGSALR